MPVKRGHDSKGSFYQWGGAKKYYYQSGNAKSRQIAYQKASKQGQAIRISEHIKKK